MTFPPDPRMMQEDARPERIHRLAWAVVVAGFLLLILFAIVPGVRLKMHDAAFRDIRPGAAKEQVVKLMGSPGAAVEAMPALERYWGDEANPAVRREDVREVLTWQIRFLTGKVTWQVGFDAAGRAVVKHRYE